MATAAKLDYYEILSVTRTASEQEIKGAFLKLAGAYQAQKPLNIDAVERFREIARAYRILSDPKRKQGYDQSGETWLAEDCNVNTDRLTESESQASDDTRWLLAAILEGTLHGLLE